MSLATRTLPGRIEPSNVFFGRKECTKVVTVADSSGSLDATYFTINVPASLLDSSKLAVSYYVWIDVDNTSIDPAPAGLTGIEVDIATDDDAATVAAAIKTAIDALSPKRFTVQVNNSNEVLIENRELGAVTAASDTGSTGFTITTELAGNGGDLGATQGGITLNQEFETIDITSDQTGGLILDQFYNGGSINIEAAFQEMDISKWESLVGSVVGSKFSPAGGTDVVGVGESKLFQSFLAQAGQLIIKPLGQSDNSRNITFWRAAPLPGSINYDTEIQALSCTFTALLDSSIDTSINAYIFGDSDQDGLY